MVNLAISLAVLPAPWCVRRHPCLSLRSREDPNRALCALPDRPWPALPGYIIAPGLCLPEERRVEIVATTSNVEQVIHQLLVVAITFRQIDHACIHDQQRRAIVV